MKVRSHCKRTSSKFVQETGAINNVLVPIAVQEYTRVNIWKRVTRNMLIMSMTKKADEERFMAPNA
jgi:hypothetical protein